MTLANLSAMWAAIAPGLGNHLWQSTLFAAAAGLLTLILRKDQARVRYWIWLAASLKFLVPFSLLVSIGNHVPWSHGSVQTGTGLYFAIQEMNQPFASATMPAVAASAAAPVAPGFVHLLPALLLSLWLGGVFVVLSLWWARWRRVSRAMLASAPLREGREVEALRRLIRVAGLRRPIELVLSPSSLEPGIFGIARPVLIWPQGISERLENAHLEAILAHEVWHVRRHDNMAAAIHMVVEALFWFHPLVWWVGARLVEERERACDEEVLELGSERQVYAESILKVCEFCVGSPLACVAGVTGADLKKRMVSIMTKRIARKLDFGRKLLLSAAVTIALALPIGFGVMNATQGRAVAQEENATSGAAYKSASIKPHQSVNGVVEHVGVFFSPHGFSARGATLQTVLGAAYGVQADLISGAPEWVNSEKYDIDVNLPDSAVEDASRSNPEGIGIQLRSALQAILADRFKLALHQQTKDLQVYELVVAEGGSKMQEAKPAYTNPNGINGPEGRLPQRGMMQMGPGELIDQGTTLAPLVEQLSWQLGRTVVDKTGLTGNYDFTLRWTPDGTEAGMAKLMGSGPATHGAISDAARSSLFTAIQEQLGLKLESVTSPMKVLVVDHVERPGDGAGL